MSWGVHTNCHVLLTPASCEKLEPRGNVDTGNISTVSLSGSSMLKLTEFACRTVHCWVAGLLMYGTLFSVTKQRSSRFHTRRELTDTCILLGFVVHWFKSVLIDYQKRKNEAQWHCGTQQWRELMAASMAESSWKMTTWPGMYLLSGLFRDSNLLIWHNCLHIVLRALLFSKLPAPLPLSLLTAKPKHSLDQTLFYSKTVFVPRTAESQPIGIKFCTHTCCCTEYTCGPT